MSLGKQVSTTFTLVQLSQVVLVRYNYGMESAGKPINDERLGKLIRWERENIGLTQTALANGMGEILGITVHKTIISKIEAGKRPLSLREAVAISNILHIPVKALVDSLTGAPVTGEINEVFERIRQVLEKLGTLLVDFTLYDYAPLLDDIATIKTWAATALMEQQEKRKTIIALLNDMEAYVITAVDYLRPIGDYFSICGAMPNPYTISYEELLSVLEDMDRGID